MTPRQQQVVTVFAYAVVIGVGVLLLLSIYDLNQRVNSDYARDPIVIELHLAKGICAETNLNDR